MSVIVEQNYFVQTAVQAFTFTRQRGKRDKDSDQSDRAYSVYNEYVI